MAAVAEWYGHRIVAGFVTSSSPVPLKTRRVGQRCTLNLSRAEMSSRCPRAAEQCDVNLHSLTHAVSITAIEIEGPTNNITVCSLYRSPTSPINSFIPDLIKIFRNRAQGIAVGDYNAKHSTWNRNRRGDLAGTKLLNYANACGFVISAPTDPTRIPHQQNHQPSVIDLGVSCGLNIAVESRYDLSSDHNPVHFVVKFNFKTSHLLNCKTITNWNKFQDILSTTIAGKPLLTVPKKLKKQSAN
ncbi:hypothetical protein TNCV_2959641 [Trichonephila clavipes]|nr:hypothetical protein TNCV_2959641 [Trichonephila clavipes]